MSELDRLTRTHDRSQEISERSHVDELSDHWLWKLGRDLDGGDDGGGGTSWWRWLASELALGNDDVARIRENPCSGNRGYEVIRCWAKLGEGSSIRVLKNVMRDVLKRNDLVKLIDKARRSQDSLH